MVKLFARRSGSHAAASASDRAPTAAGPVRALGMIHHLRCPIGSWLYPRPLSTPARQKSLLAVLRTAYSGSNVVRTRPNGDTNPTDRLLSSLLFLRMPHGIH